MAVVAQSVWNWAEKWVVEEDARTPSVYCRATLKQDTEP